MKKITLLIITAIFTLTIAACVTQVETETMVPMPPEIETVSPTQTKVPPTPMPTNTPTPTLSVLETADVIIKALKAKDLGTVATYVHPQLGLRFTPYSFIRSEDRLFSQQAVSGLFEDETLYNWGAFDGSGEPIEMTFSDYFERFVYSHDFATPEIIGLNKEIGKGNSINNLSEFYPGSDFVEYHFTGFESQYEGMDWESLRLVFKQENGIYYLIGIVHAEWTI